MMKELFEAIYALFAGAGGAALRAKATGGMFPQVAPQGTSPIYITYALISSVVDWTFESLFDAPMIQFSMWDDDPAPDDVLATMALFNALYNDALLTLTNYYTVRADKIGERVLEDPDKGFQGIVEMRFLLQTK